MKVVAIMIMNAEKRERDRIFRSWRNEYVFQRKKWSRSFATT